jgi:thimet oligopeptidase
MIYNNIMWCRTFDWKLLEEPDYVKNVASKYISDINTTYQNIIDVKEKRTWDNTIKPLNDLDHIHSINHMIIMFPNMVYPNQYVRDQSDKYKIEIQNVMNEWMSNRYFYDAIQHYWSHIDEELNEEQRMVIEKLFRLFGKSGVMLDETKRLRVSEINNEIVKLGTEYETNSRDHDRKYLFTAKELAGIPDSILESKNKVVDTNALYNLVETNLMKRRKISDDPIYYVMSLQYPDYFAIMDYCDSSQIRKLMYSEFSSKCVDDNVCILEQIIKLRQELASLYSVPTFAHLAIKHNMAQTPEAVYEFLNDLKRNLQSVFDCEMKQYTILNNGDTPKIYDISYLMNKYKELYARVDMKTLRHWFPLNKVIEGTFKAYSQLFSLEFKIQKVPLWQSDVTFYEVFDSKNKEYLGGLYLDLFPRNGKYNHACCNPLTKRSVDTKGNINYPVAVMICNFSDNEMEFDEVVTYFHEFGHAIHHLCGKTNYADTEPHEVEIDFVECPSQMFEYFCTEKDVLELLTSYVGNDSMYKQNQTMPIDLINKIKIQQMLGEGYSQMRQISLAMTDMKLHMNKEINIYKLYHETCYDTLGLKLLTKSNLFGDFSHMVGEYSAGYYSYLWSKVYASDMFYSRFKNDCLNPELGYEFRQKVFAPGSSKYAMTMIIDFLGRKPSSDVLKNEFAASLDYCRGTKKN